VSFFVPRFNYSIIKKDEE